MHNVLDGGLLEALPSFKLADFGQRGHRNAIFRIVLVEILLNPGILQRLFG